MWGGNSAPEKLHEIVGTHGRALLRSVPLDRALGTKSLVCIGLKQAKYFHLVARTNTKEVNRDRRTHCTNSWSNLTLKCNANTFVKVDTQIVDNCRLWGSVA